MHDNPLDHEDPSQAAIKFLDERIVRALETVRQPQIPAGFAARVASQLPAPRPETLTPTHYGRYAMVIGTLVTLAAMLLLAVHPSGNAAFGLVESLLLAQFIALAVCLSVWRPGLR
jgi:hypothetical protein